MTVPRTRVRALLVAAPTLVALGLTASPASAAAVVARWEMNEGGGAATMQDSSGHGINGRVGSDVQTHSVFAGRTGYTFPFLKNGVPPTHPGHLVTVPADDRLNPGTGDYSVSITLRIQANANGGNIMQKGQASSPGGYFKLEVHHGVVSCLFRGRSGSAAVGTGVIDNNAWHSLTCSRTAGAVQMTVDGRVTATKRTATGSISNAAPLTIGGKSSCNQRTVQCDYFAGSIDRVQING